MAWTVLVCLEEWEGMAFRIRGKEGPCSVCRVELVFLAGGDQLVVSLGNLLLEGYKHLTIRPFVPGLDACTR